MDWSCLDVWNCRIATVLCAIRPDAMVLQPLHWPPSAFGPEKITEVLAVTVGAADERMTMTGMMGVGVKHTGHGV